MIGTQVILQGDAELVDLDVSALVLIEESEGFVQMLIVPQLPYVYRQSDEFAEL